MRKTAKSVIPVN